MTKTGTAPDERGDLVGIAADIMLTCIPLGDVRALAEKGRTLTEIIAYLVGSSNAYNLASKVSGMPEPLRLVFQDMVNSHQLVIHMVEEHGLESAQAEIEKLPTTKVSRVVAEA